MPLCVSTYMCLVVTCWERADLLTLVCGVELWVCHIPIGILGQVWYLIVSIPDLCTLTYIYKISTTWHNDRNWIEPAAKVGYRSWLLFLISIIDLQDMFCILFAFSQTLLSCEATDCLIMQEQVSIARNATITHCILVNPYDTVRKRQWMTTETWHTEDNTAYDSGRLIGQMS